MKRIITSLFFLSMLVFCPITSYGQVINVDAKNLVPKTSIFLSPSSSSFVEGSTFEIPIIIDTKGNNINGIDITVKFDKDKLSIVQPSGGNSIVGVWVEPPFYDNSKGVASYVGVIPGGITTSSGVVGTITFKAKSLGKALVSISNLSKVLLNDGLGTEAKVETGRGEYSIIQKPSAGVIVFSETHPFSGDWYNNNSPVLSWDKEPGVSGFSYVIDNKPNTIPDNTLDTEDNIVSFEDLDDGLWYFHIKSNKNGVWGQTGNYLLKIDTTPPADFKPEVNYLLASTVLVERTLISFLTTDNLSGIDYYEVGIIDKSQPTTISPVFVESESPFQAPLNKDSNLHIIVRAFDKAGNVRESSIDVKSPIFVGNFIKNYIYYFLGFILLIIISLAILFNFIKKKALKKASIGAFDINKNINNFHS